jgi:hypothetical protein
MVGGSLVGNVPDAPIRESALAKAESRATEIAPKRTPLESWYAARDKSEMRVRDLSHLPAREIYPGGAREYMQRQGPAAEPPDAKRAENPLQIVNDPRSSLAELQSRWHTLCDLDRARAIQSMRQAGVGVRELAGRLNCSPSLLSYLQWAARASAENRELARSGGISTRELVRRARSSASHSISFLREALAFEDECEAIQASRAISKWLDEEGIMNDDRVKVYRPCALTKSKR